MPPTEAVSVIQAYRRHPQWAVLGFPVESLALHDELWRLAAQTGFARRRIYDVRLALALRHHGVTEFATANIKYFDGLGFDRVWNPIGQKSEIKKAKGKDFDCFVVKTGLLRPFASISAD